MTTYLLKRILWFIPTLIAISFLAFGLSKCTPGDPVMQACFPEDTPFNEDVFELEYRRCARSLGLDRPSFYFSLSSAAYPDTLYVTELVAPGVVNTMPEKTLDATFDHGTVTGNTISRGYDDANATLNALDALGISYNDVVAVLESEGLDKFVASWKELLADVEGALAAARKDA